MTKTVKCAFLGAGNMAEQHAKAFAALDNVQLVGIHSRTRTKAEAMAQRHGIEAVFDSMEEMWLATEADILIVTVKELQLLEVVQQACAFGWALFLEKPAGYNLEVAAQVRDTIKNKGREAYVGLNRRFYDSVLQAQKKLGDSVSPRHIVVTDQQSFAEARGVGHPEEVVRYFMYANSIHLVDYVRNFGRGEIDNVSTAQTWQGEDSFIVSSLVTFSSGDTARYEAVWNAPGPWSCTVTNAEQRLEMRPLESLGIQLAGTRKVDMAEIDAVDQDFKPGFYRQAQHVVRAVRGEQHNVPTIDQSFEVMELINAIYGM